MRDAFFNELDHLMAEDERIMLLLGDVGAITLDVIRERFPERVINMGVAERNMVGVAAGLALSGKVPYVFTHAIFATSSAYEGIKLDVCLQSLPVKIIGCGPGLDYSLLGPSHHATDDVGLMRLLPNMTILSPADDVAAAAFAGLSLKVQGPVYIRLDREGQPLVYSNGTPDFSRGLHVMRDEGTICVVATGRMVAEALARQAPMVVDLYCLKPLNVDLLREVLDGREVITLEEHNVIGGLGSAVSEVLAGVERIGVYDCFVHECGPREYLRGKIR